MHERWPSIAFSVLLGIGALMAAPVGAATVNPATLRPAVTLSGNGWKFGQRYWLEFGAVGLLQLFGTTCSHPLGQVRTSG